jgi:glycolate oxidase iron-sulfur subunit
MQTKFSTTQLADPATAAAAGAVRACVHCGFCTATCPTYVLLGNELDSPRGRIYLVKEMLEKAALPSPQVVKHLDRCLSCLACETACPSGVSYRRIIDRGRAYVEEHYRRPVRDRLLRTALAAILPFRGRLRVALWLAVPARPLAGLFERMPSLRPLGTMLRLSDAVRAPGGRGGPTRQVPPAGQAQEMSLPSESHQAQEVSRTHECSPSQRESRARGPRGSLKSYRVGLVRGCVEPVLDPDIQAAAVRLLERAGCEVVRVERDGCCGALPHHLGRDAQALMMARASIDAWHREVERGSLEAIVVTASGCGTVIRDYGYLLRDDPQYAAKAARISALACDITELLDRIGLPPAQRAKQLNVAYHAPCSLQHGQQLRDLPARLLVAAGFAVRLPTEAHLCCGSAGVYNILQPDIAGQLGARKAASLDALEPDVIATGNIGCMVQIGRASAVPVVHVAQLLDWASGGPAPAGVAAAVLDPGR